mmetsp:Transcript_46699/g.113711  ORF Transcript_46699/g.113711 Transcript_46699/m.113711 type:complete len:236 (-) Transcript_46699:2061-2768(-)
MQPSCFGLAHTNTSATPPFDDDLVPLCCRASGGSPRSCRRRQQTHHVTLVQAAHGIQKHRAPEAPNAQLGRFGVRLRRVLHKVSVHANAHVANLLDHHQILEHLHQFTKAFEVPVPSLLGQLKPLADACLQPILEATLIDAIPPSDGEKILDMCTQLREAETVHTTPVVLAPARHPLIEAVPCLLGASIHAERRPQLWQLCAHQLCQVLQRRSCGLLVPNCAKGSSPTAVLLLTC